MELLIIFAKTPEPGKVKSRLARDIGQEKALDVYRGLLDNTFKVAANTGKNVHVCLSGNRVDNLHVPDHFSIGPQVGHDLGERMHNGISEGLQKGYQSVVLVGGDIYELDENILSKAFASLANSDVVLGPALDGGYYLIGMKAEYPAIFRGIPWSTKRVMKKTLEKIHSLNLSYAILPTLSDVDDLHDLVKCNIDW